MRIMDSFSVALLPWGTKPINQDDVAKAAKHAEELGFYSLTIPVILRLPDEPLYARFGNENIVDPLVLFPVVAQATKSIRIGVHSMVLPLLPPYVWAKYIASLDLISGGRVDAGMCLGFSQRQFDAVDISVKKRARMSDEQVEVITRLWTEERVTHQGQFYNLKDVTLEPKPAQKPHPPIWWGGGQASIARAARWCEYIATPFPTVREVKEEYIPRLKEECHKWGTNTKVAGWVFSTIDPHKDFSEQDLRDWILDLLWHEGREPDPREATIAGSPQQCADKINAFRDAGLSHFIFDFQRHGLDSVSESIRQMDLFVERVVPLLK
ncbi:MAG: LLM class flavin-dependent oxidoreductase [Dehalococcoidia bacterium]